MIVFTDGSETEYVYSATGEKLRVIHITAKPNVVTREVGKEVKDRLSGAYWINYEKTDYLLGGALTLKNGRIDKYQFDEGYCQAEKYSATQDDFTFCYYDQDHLGNIRQVTEADGTKKGAIIQKMNYYPFGAEFCDGGTKSFVQNHKYNGKEFDHMHGLNTYDYGARQYNPVTGRWDRMDQLSEDYYSYSPYNYCLNNPVKNIDPDGRYVWLLYNVTINGETTQKKFYFDGTQSKCPNDPFIKAFIKVYNTLKAMGTGKPLIEGVTSKKIGMSVGASSEYKNSYDPDENTVWWNYKQASYTDEGGVQSAAVGLVHEFDHGVDYNKHPNEHLSNTDPKTGYDPQYGNKEERRVITGSEKETAEALGQATRTNHSGIWHGCLGFDSQGPLSIKPKRKVQVAPTHKRPKTSFLTRFFN